MILLTLGVILGSGVSWYISRHYYRKSPHEQDKSASGMEVDRRFDEVAEQILAEIGMQLILVQDLERFMSFALKASFEGNIETIKANLLSEDRNTMGQVLRARA